MSARPNALLMLYRMNALSSPVVRSPSIASSVPYQKVTPSVTTDAAMSAPWNRAPDHPYRISTSNAFPTAPAKWSASAFSLANARTVRIAPRESSATAVASASAVCVSLERTRSRRPCHMAATMRGGNAAITTRVRRQLVLNMKMRPMTAVANPRRNMDRFCVATFFRRAVSAVRREINAPLVTESKKPISWVRMFVKRRLRSLATTLYDAVLNR